jgi:hypothetical protein
MRSVPEIQEDLNVAYLARRAAMRVASVSTGDGVSKANQQLPTLNQTIALLEAEKAQAESAANSEGTTTLIFITTMRGL